MKRLSTILALVLAIVVSSCKYDDTLVWNSIDELKQRMSALETVMKAYENNLFIESIDEIDNGYIITFSDGSKATIVDGENGKDGADGKDGETYIHNISIEGDKVMFTLTDGTMFSIPLYSMFDIVFESTEGLICYPGVSVEVGYTVIGAIGDVSIECFGNGGWDAMIEDGDGTSGKIKVTAPKDDSAEQGKIVVIALSGGNNICMKSIYFDKGVIVDILDNYEVDCYPGHLEVYLRTNIDYNVIIPEDAQSWLHLIDTRTTLRDGVIAFEYDDNNSQDVRTATIQLISENGNALHCFDIIQKGNMLSGNIVFADSDVKRVCVDKFDANCDGEVSYEEASWVSKIEKNFFGDYASSVKSFDELRFFVNLKTIEGGWAINGNDGAFYECKNLISISFPTSLETIGAYAFKFCDNLRKVSISDIASWCNIKLDTASNPMMQNGAVLYLDNQIISDIEIPDNVTIIRNNAFGGCISLTSATIPDNIVSIGNSAFSGCSSLKEIYCKPTTPPTGGYNMFYNNASGRKIYVPTESVEAYKAASEWSAYADDIYGYDFENNSI